MPQNIRLRVRGPDGVSTLELPDTATVGDLKQAISKATNLPIFDIKAGYPPQPLDLDQYAEDVNLQETGRKFQGEQLIAVKRVIALPLEDPVSTPLVPPPPPSAPPAVTSTTKSVQATPKAEDPPEVYIPVRNGTVVLRVMPDDNSCMFRALSSAVLGSFDSMNELRSLVASGIQENSEKFNAAILGSAPSKYCEWISRENSWGGAIELSILSEHFDIEIASINVQDGRVDRFNEGALTRCILVYSGIHYDVIALSPGPAYSNMPADIDTKVFDSDDGAILDGARLLCGELRKRHYYTDTAGFSIKCKTCGWTGKGEKEATVHASATGHYDLEEV